MPALARVISCKTSPGNLAGEVMAPLKTRASRVTKGLEFLTVDSHESSALPVYIVAIGWLYVVIMMALTEPRFMSGAVTILCYGILPLGLLLRIQSASQRRRRTTVSRDTADEKAAKRS